MGLLDRLVGKNDNAIGSSSSSASSSSNKPTTLKDQSRVWVRELNKQNRTLEREKQSILREQQKLTQQIKLSAKKNDIKSVEIMAKSIVQSKNAINQLTESQTRINSIIQQLQLTVANNTVIGNMKQSNDIMIHMNKLTNISQIGDIAKNMSKEMMRAGLIQDTINETFDTLDDDSVQQDTQDEIQRVIYETTNGQLGSLTSSNKDRSIKQNDNVIQQQQNNTTTTTDDSNELEQMRKMLEQKT